jgi:hypothetical protein
MKAARLRSISPAAMCSTIRAPGTIAEPVSHQPAADRLFDTLSAQLDAMPPEHRSAALAPVMARIEARQGNLEGISGL